MNAGVPLPSVAKILIDVAECALTNIIGHSAFLVDQEVVPQ